MPSRILALALLCSAVATSFGQVTRTQVISNVHRPVAIAQIPGDTGRMFVVEARGVDGVVTRPMNSTTGRISCWNPTTGTEIATSLTVTGLPSDQEQGLLGIAFDPNYATNRYVYVNLTLSGPSRTEIRRYTVNDSTNVFSSAVTIFSLADPASNHNGGTIRFGKDGYLYIGMGDGGGQQDPNNRAQNINDLLGKMLRIDVTGDDFPADPAKNYRIPPTNPYVGIAGADEIWAVGLRNPWKWSFDLPKMNGMDGLVIADVGQDEMEESNHVVADKPNVNYGWKTYEGTLTTGFAGSVPITNPHWPFFTYTHTVGYSESGGAIYRGTNLGTGIYGNYFVADFSGWLTYMAMSFDNESGTLLNSILALTSTTFTPKITTNMAQQSSVELDNNGEIWLCRYNNLSAGNVGRLDLTAGNSRSAAGTLVLNDMIFGSYSTKGVTVEIRMNSNPSVVIPLTVGVSPDGRLRIPVPTGAGRVSVNHGSWLRRTVAFNTTAGNATGINVVCQNGDVDESGEVDATDIDEVIANFGLIGGDPGYAANRNSDLDRSGEVDATDIDITIANFGALDDAP